MKYEDVYLKGYATPVELMFGLTEHFAFYNDERPHQALANKTPDTAYRTGQDGGALIVDKYGPREISPGGSVESGQRCSAAGEAQAIA